MNPIQVILREKETKNYHKYESMEVPSLGIIQVYVSHKHLNGAPPPKQIKIMVEGA